jgi:hypothetical protein
VICDHLDRLSSDPDNFLWGSDGLWPNLTEDESERFMREEMPFVLASIRAYPHQELARASRSVFEQLGIFGLNDLDPSGYTLSQFPNVLPQARASYLSGRQGRNAIPLDDITSFQFWVVMASLGVILLCVPHLWRSRPAKLLGLTLIVAAVELANAAVTSTLSMVEDRLQARVVWLIPMLAMLMLLEWWSRRRGPEVSSADPMGTIENGPTLAVREPAQSHPQA